MQFLGNLFEYFLLRRRERGEDARLTILGATSGDTGKHVYLWRVVFLGVVPPTAEPIKPREQTRCIFFWWPDAVLTLGVQRTPCLSVLRRITLDLLLVTFAVVQFIFHRGLTDKTTKCIYRESPYNLESNMAMRPHLILLLLA